MSWSKSTISAGAWQALNAIKPEQLLGEGRVYGITSHCTAENGGRSYPRVHVG